MAPEDCGHWYRNGVLAPLLTGVSIAVDPATRENGCLQAIPGSHAPGRIDRALTGDQAGAGRERVDAILGRLPLVHIEMQPGDALYFHANPLHRSDRNESENPRWSMICRYNAARNDPYKDAHHPRYKPFDRVPGTGILAAGAKRFADSKEDVAWLDIVKGGSFLLNPKKTLALRAIVTASARLAQTDRGNVTVTDQSGAIVPGAAVSATHASRGPLPWMAEMWRNCGRYEPYAMIFLYSGNGGAGKKNTPGRVQ